MVLMLNDVWDTTGKETVRHQNPSLNIIMEGLDKLDGDNQTELSLEHDDGNLLSCGGGPELFLVNFLLPQDQGEWILVEDSNLDGTVELAIGRSPASYPRSRLVSQNPAKRAFAYFYEKRDRDPEMHWYRSY
jgi:hypothetical protein